jgi:hypothetical protein
MEGSVFQLQGLPLPRIEHNHGAGQWDAMEEVSAPHDSAEHDPERAWQKGRVFRCTTCEDEIRVVLDDERESPQP